MIIKSGKCVGGGRCEECGKCNLYDTTTRKKKLTYLPEGFVPDMESEDPEQRRYGIAFDIGTTTVVGMLWNLNSDTLVDMIAKTNPQSQFGSDVISRITYSMEGEQQLKMLQDKIIGCFNEMIDEFTSQSQNNKQDGETVALYPQEIIRATVVGNTTMGHLFLGIDPSSLARAPFDPAYTGPVWKKAGEMNININRNADIYLLPNIAGHVGSDIIGVLLASGLEKMQGLNLAIDIGTNGEIVLEQNGRMLTCSTAAGPAFEGARIYQGMRAARGSIERVEIQDGEVRIEVIEDCEPIGICGSGLIDAVAQMLDAGILNFKGNIITAEEASTKGFHPELVERLRKGKNGNEFVLVWKAHSEDIVINQKDIREVQLAKGAIYGGIIILMQCMGVDTSMLDKILLAGAFGSYISKKSALRIGLLPVINEEKIEHIGNAAGVGSCMALLSKHEREEAVRQSVEVEHVELALHPNFEREYLQAMYFPR